MTTKKSEFFEKLYIIDVNSVEVSDEQMKSFVLCGDSHWDYYFQKLLVTPSQEGISEIQNVSLHEFTNQEDMHAFLQGMNERKVLDFCEETNFYAVLEVN